MREPKIYMRMALRNGPLDLLPHWVKHYTDWGIDGFAITVQSDENQPHIHYIKEEFEKCGKPFDLNIVGYFNDGQIEDQIMPKHLKSLGWNRASNWIGHADLDEFWQIPRPLNELVLRMDALGHTAFHGNIIDRITADGSLVDAVQGIDIRDQYPLECSLTSSIGQALTRKVILSRGDVHVSGGHHYANGDSIQYVGGYGHVHHFKWRAGLTKRLRWGLENTGPPDSWWGREALRFLEFFGQNEKVPINDPRIGARPANGAPKILPRTRGFNPPSP